MECVLELLESSLPEYWSLLDPYSKGEEQLAYSQLGSYLSDKLRQKDAESVAKIADFLNILIESKDTDVENLINVGVFEGLLADDFLFPFLRQYLKPKTEAAFSYTMRAWRIE